MKNPKPVIFAVFATVLVGLFSGSSASAAADPQAPFSARSLPVSRGLDIGDPLWHWPVEEPRLAKPFRKPTSDWGAGHRGIDLQTKPGEALLSPVDARIDFGGLAFGVPTVVIEAGSLSSVFQPACLKPGFSSNSQVEIGDDFARVCSSSAQHHCSLGDCLHWSLRWDKTDYLNPLIMLDELDPAILLKPPTT